jgi:D-threonine aldolase
MTANPSKIPPIKNLDEIPSPALLIFPDRVARNIQRMVSMAGGADRLRPHLKTHKLPQIVQMQGDAGIRKFKAATIAEAEMALAAGAQDVLLAYPIVGPNIDRFIRLMAAYPDRQLAALFDDPLVAQRIGHNAQGAGAIVRLYLDLNVGMQRTGIAPGPDAAHCYRHASALEGIELGGLHAYDGHLQQRDPNELADAVARAFAPVWTLRDSLREQGLRVPRIIASGTPTFPLLAEHADVEVGCGTTLLWDFGQADICPTMPFEHAALLLTRVISRPTSDRICFDLGHKSVAAEMPQPRVRLLGLEDAVIVMQSEEHLVVQSERAGQYQPGTAVLAIPRHVCPTVALYHEACVVHDERVDERWPVVARVRQLTV